LIYRIESTEVEYVNISQEVDSWIAESELPTRADLRPVSRFDDLYDDEYLSAGEAERLIMLREYGPVLGIPKPAGDRDNFCTFESDDAVSFAFSSADYRRLHPFNYEAWQVRQICERAKDLGQTHSCISHEDGKRNTLKRFIEFAAGYPQHKAKLYSIWAEHAYEKKMEVMA
jgi:hypothetical protein